MGIARGGHRPDDPKASRGGNASSSYGRARIGRATIVPAVADSSQQVQDSFQKQPDVTVLLRVKGSAAPSATAIFRTSLNFALFPDQEWHWAIVKAKGIRPPTLPVTMTQPADEPLPAHHDSGTGAVARESFIVESVFTEAGRRDPLTRSASQNVFRENPVQHVNSACPVKHEPCKLWHAKLNLNSTQKDRR